ncbi:hypothetical protein [Streptococcus ovuberis]|uniref:Glucosyltransferase n=1 Tax=Streptococcus ovuberis TaxID=1936207 RepID=A0A7X6MVV0_9STRE|nr:hypothetical protein [Streptococcus ovuberis]NKZ19365.1 hypothetical protein [Streptococcus ovuberis]
MISSRFKLKRPYLFWGLLIVLVIYRIALIAGSPWALFATSGYDDIMQMKLGASMAAWEWMGDKYFYTTLVKNIGFPFFLGLSKWLHIPYGVLYGILITGSSYLFIRAISPLVRNNKLLLLFYAIIIFIPINQDAVYRVYRNALVPWVFLMVVSCMLALFIRRNDSISKQIIWSMGAALSIAMFWTLREDSVWIIPFVVAVSFTIILCQVIENRQRLPRLLIRCLIAVLPFSGILLIHNIVSTINYHHYGIYAMNDKTQTYSPKVMSLLYKIDDGQTTDPNVWASRKAFEMALEASPTMRTEEDIILSAYGLWAGGETDIRGDISQWALRYALSEVGYYRDNAQKTNEFYKKVYEELSTAFETGKLTKKPGLYLSSQTGAFHLRDIWESIIMSLKASWNISLYSHTDLEKKYLDYPDFTAGDIDFFEDLLSTALPRTENQLKTLGFDGSYTDYDEELSSLANTNVINNRRILRQREKNYRKQQRIVSIYRFISVIAVPLSYLGFILLLKDCVSRKWKLSEETLTILLTILGLALTGFLNIFVVILFSRWITTDPNHIVIGFYASSAYLLFALANLFSCWMAIKLGYSNICLLLKGNVSPETRAVGEKYENY